jgi:hypothetical protein
MMATRLNHHTGIMQKCRPFHDASALRIQLVQWLRGLKKLSRKAFNLPGMRPVFNEQAAAQVEFLSCGSRTMPPFQVLY